MTKRYRHHLEYGRASANPSHAHLSSVEAMPEQPRNPETILYHRALRRLRAPRQAHNPAIVVPPWIPTRVAAEDGERMWLVSPKQAAANVAQAPFHHSVSWAKSRQSAKSIPSHVARIHLYWMRFSSARIVVWAFHRVRVYVSHAVSVVVANAAASSYIWGGWSTPVHISPNVVWMRNVRPSSAVHKMFSFIWQDVEQAECLPTSCLCQLHRAQSSSKRMNVLLPHKHANPFPTTHKPLCVPYQPNGDSSRRVLDSVSE